MKRIVKRVYRGIVAGVAALLIAGYPLTAFADTASETPPPPPKTYTYDPATQHWSSNEWQYDPVSGTYKPVPVQPPAEPTPAPKDPATTETQSPTPATQESQSRPVSEVTQPPTSAQKSTTSNTNTDTHNTIDTTQTSQSTSGNATVDRNTTAGSATTGGADAATTLINTIHSTVQGDTSGIAQFTTDITGNVVGDITLSPVIDGMAAHPSGTTSSTLNASDNNTIHSTVNLAATSGDAAVTNNGTAGSATSGNANATANVINLINSIIAANKSFVGTINIYGNLNGDILVSPSFIPQLVAANAPNTTSGTAPDNLSVADLNSQQSIINNVTLDAKTGQASVDHNTTAGTATTGQAGANLTILNLTGRQVVAKNSMLVFVNVLGKWVGMIVNAPSGATAAALASGMTTNSSASTTTNAQSNNQIVNDINLAAASGDATVAHNTLAGNATTGNATASANIANISTSVISLSDWFGVLFINVYGSWYGSFGIDTANGTVVPVELPGQPLQPTTSGGLAPNIQFGFRPHMATTSSMSSFTSDAATDSQSTPAVLAASTVQTSPKAQAQTATAPAVSQSSNQLLHMIIVAVFLGAAIFAAFWLLRG